MLEFIKNNYQDIILSVFYLVMGLELLARFTPTKKDDALLERVGRGIRKLMDWLKIPNVKR